MVDFASVYNLANKPTEPFPDWVEQQKGMAQLDAMNQANKTNAFDLQQKQQSLADAMALKKDLMTAKNSDEAMKILINRGKFKEAEDLATSVKKNEEAKLGFKKVLTEMNDSDIKHMQETSEVIGNHARVALSKPNEMEAWQYWRSVAPTLHKFLEDTEGDSAKMKLMKDHARRKIENELPLLAKPTNINSLLQEYVDNSKKTVDWINEEKALDPMAKVNADLEAGRITKEDAEKRKEYLTTRNSAVQVNLPGAPQKGIDPKTGKPVFWRPGKTGGVYEIIEDVYPEERVRDVPVSVVKDFIDNENMITSVSSLKKLLEKNPSGLGFKNLLPNVVLQRADPSGEAVRALIAQIESLKIKDISGAAVSVSESERLRKFLPNTLDTKETVINKLNNLERELSKTQVGFTQAYSEGYRQIPQFKKYAKANKEEAPKEEPKGNRSKAQKPVVSNAVKDLF